MLDVLIKLVLGLVSSATMEKSDIETQMEPFPWHLGVYDAHCHPTDTVSSLSNIPGMETKILTIMATRGEDQDIVASFAEKYAITSRNTASPEGENEEASKGRLIPCFGWHPWFSHQIYDDVTSGTEQKTGSPSKDYHYRKVLSPAPSDEKFLDSMPAPRPLSGLLAQMRGHLEKYPVGLVGEIGLDRSFRIPVPEVPKYSIQGNSALTPGGREGRQLSPYHVNLEHQQRILKAQLHLAGEMNRAVSVHGVAAHGVVFQTLAKTWHGFERPVLSRRALKRRQIADGTIENDGEPQKMTGESRPYPPRICLHSYSGPPDTLKLYLQPSIPAIIFFSFSHLVNFSSPTSRKVVNAIKLVPDDRILVESDLHAAGTRMDDLMEDIVRTICNIKGWSLTAGTKQLGRKYVPHNLYPNDLTPKSPYFLRDARTNHHPLQTCDANAQILGSWNHFALGKSDIK